ncbi:MAG: flagellar protein [Phycisphaera sp.]|nr:MAG: flagellar protein [Phycisphaera sp.]
MINVTRLNGQAFVLNADLIKTVEQKPDTIITLVNGDHIVVREAMRDVIERVIEYGRRLRRLTPVD